MISLLIISVAFILSKKDGDDMVPVFVIGMFSMLLEFIGYFAILDSIL